MPNRGTHIGIGIGLVILLSYVLNNYLRLTNIDSFALLGVLLGSIIPDILDPPTSYKHRRFFHSKRVRKYMGYVSIGVVLVIITPLLNAVTFFCLGYFLHLMADSTTPMGLPE
jgi:membrane-bound metal-dependent hydrolase YbcI (DUF457 family)